MSEDEQPPSPKKARSNSGAKGRSRVPAGKADTAELTSLIWSTVLEVLGEREKNPGQSGVAVPGTGEHAPP